MGVVWKARDTKLDRDVALKVLPAAVAANAERVARFEREARLLAALSHPNIAAIHGFEHASSPETGPIDVRFLVMELVGGDDLALLQRRGPLPVSEVVAIYRQVADALEAAHDRGIIHRDLKPANIKVTPAGRVKVLDFGLAKALQPDPDLTDPTQSPTVTSGGTREGVILGTAAYMSPEQARGLPLDARTDLWSFGCMLYEALGGVAPFRGDTVPDTLAAVLGREPDWTRLPQSAPASLTRVIRRCLRKDARRRPRDIRDVGLELDDALSGTDDGPGPAPLPEPLPQSRLPYWAAVALLAAGLAAGAWLFPRAREAAPLEPAISRFTIVLPEPLAIDIGQRDPLALSPDGSLLAFVGRDGQGSQLYLRPLASLDLAAVADTLGGEGPFFSPDGKWLGFLRQNNLMKAPVGGGAPLPIASVPPIARGFDWPTDRDVFLCPSKVSGLYRVSADGGVAKRQLLPDEEAGEEGYVWPQVLPGGSEVLLTVKMRRPTYDDARIVLRNLDDDSTDLLVEGGYHGRLLPNGILVYVRGGELLAARLDPQRHRLVSPAVPVLDGFVTDPSTGTASFSFSGDGTLAFVRGGTYEWQRGKLVWVDRQGRVEEVSPEVHSFRYPRVSPDGMRLAFTVEEASDDVWLYDLARGSFTRLTLKNRDLCPLWGPGRDAVTFASVSGTEYPGIFTMPADGSAEPRRIFQTEKGPVFPSDWSPDGKTLAYVRRFENGNGFDIMMLQAGEAGPGRAFLDSRFDEHMPTFSPDGHWLAYSSNESGRMEVYVQPWPGPGGKWKVSTDGGGEPVWNPAGGELFYRNGNRMMAVEVETEPEFRASRPRLLFDKGFAHRTLAWITNYDVSRDGQRFLMIQEAPRPDTSRIEIVLNWFADVERILEEHGD